MPGEGKGLVTPKCRSEQMATRNRRRRRRRSTIRRRWKTFVVALGFCALAVAVAVGFGAAWAVRVYNSAPPLSSLKPVQKGRSSAIYARDGTLIGFIRSENVRQPVPAKSLPQVLKDATVAIEDKNFFKHGALDPEGIARAAWKDALAGGK